MTDADRQGLEWAVAQRELIRQTNLWIDEAMPRQDAIPWMGTTDESTFMLSWVPHYFLTGRRDVRDFMIEMRDRWLDWADGNLPHGYFQAEAEEHHHTEDYIRFLTRLWYVDPYDDRNVRPIVHFAHHLGNWAQGVKPWYDWEKHVFVSRYVGTWRISDDPEHLYNTPTFLRYCLVLFQTFLMTGEARYLDLARDYADAWVRLLERVPEDAELPSKVDLDWNVLESTDPPTTWLTGGFVSTMIDLFLTTGEERYARAAARVLARVVGKEGPMYDPYGATSSYLSSYRLATGDTSFDGRVRETAEALPASGGPDELRGTGLLPHLQLSWAYPDVGADRLGGVGRASQLSLAYHVTGDPAYATRAMRDAAHRVEIARSLGDDGRDHGCASGNTNGVVLDTVLTSLYPLAMGLAGLSARATGHHKPLVTYRKQDGSLGLPHGVAALFEYGECAGCAPGAYVVTLANLNGEPCVVRVVGHDGYMKRRTRGLPWAITRQGLVPGRVPTHPWEEISTVAVKLQPGEKRTVRLPEAPEA